MTSLLIAIKRPIPPRVEVSRRTSEFYCRLVPNSVPLQRYSALTFNGHRIHYSCNCATAEDIDAMAERITI